jgi:hypothetical protein
MCCMPMLGCKEARWWAHCVLCCMPLLPPTLCWVRLLPAACHKAGVVRPCNYAGERASSWGSSPVLGSPLMELVTDAMYALHAVAQVALDPVQYARSGAFTVNFWFKPGKATLGSPVQ